MRVSLLVAAMLGREETIRVEFGEWRSGIGLADESGAAGVEELDDPNAVPEGPALGRWIETYCSEEPTILA
jgi:hypothetical protein